MLHRLIIVFLSLCVIASSHAEEKKLSPLSLGGSVFGGKQDQPSKKWLEKKRAVLKSIDQKRISVQVLQRSLGKDAKVLFNYVQKNIRFEPYAGQLRNAQGTLVAQAGNSVDRALLLAALLKSAGIKSRFATAQLDAALTNRLLEQSIGQAKPKKLKNAKMEQVYGIASGQLMTIGDALEKNKFAFPGDFSFAWHQASAAINQHYWVQIQVGEQWQDLDPTPGVEFGKSLLPAKSTVTRIPASLTHRVKLEFFIAADNKTVSVLSKTIDAHKAASQVLGYYFKIANSQLSVQLLQDGRYISSARAGRKIKLGFTLGKHESRLAPSRKVINLFGSLPGGPAKKSETSQAKTGQKQDHVAIQAAYLVVEIQSPGKTTKRKHPLFDLSANRQLPFKQQKEKFLAAIEQTGAISVRGGETSGHLLAQLFSKVRKPGSHQAIIHQLHVLNSLYALTRDAFPDSVGNKVLRFYDAPNVVVSDIHFIAKGKTATRMDLTHKSYQLLWLPDIKQVKLHPFLDYVHNGVLDHTVERLVLGHPDKDHSVGQLTELAIAQKQPLQMQLYKDARITNKPLAFAAMQDYVYLTFSALPAGWNPDSMGGWIIAPKSGWTIDRNLAGYRTAATEYGTGAAERASWAPRIRNLGCAIAVVVGSSAVQIGEGMQMFDPADGTVLVTIGSAIEALGELGCKKTPSIPGPRLRGPAGFTPGRGFTPRPDAIINRFTNMRGTIRRFR